MCNLVFVLLVALCSTSPILGQNISGYEEKGCTLPDRSRGVCKLSSECLRSGTNSTECSSQRGIVYVCCEPTKTGSPSHVGTGRTIESPREVELNETSETGNGTNDDKIADRFFLFDEPISANWPIKVFEVALFWVRVCAAENDGTPAVRHEISNLARECNYEGMDETDINELLNSHNREFSTEELLQLELQFANEEGYSDGSIEIF